MTYSDRRAQRALARLFITFVALALTVLAAEGFTRITDGYRLWSLPLASDVPAGGFDNLASTYASRVETASGVDPAWYREDPSQPTGGIMPPDEDLKTRYWAHPGFSMSSVYEWNAEYVRRVVCEDDKYRGLAPIVFGPLDDIFTFEPGDGADSPPYRFLPNARYPSGLLTNAFGWRGPQVPATKKPQTVRIAFVGASTTVDPHGDRFAYPDYIRRWLEIWAAAHAQPVRFDVINAGREGIDSTGIAAVVARELVHVEPDLVIYYEGSNGFWPADFVEWPGGRQPVPPVTVPPPRWKIEQYSTLSRRLHAVRFPSTLGTAEPPKPPSKVKWPDGLDEREPRLDHPMLPGSLKDVLRNLDSMQVALRPTNGRLLLSSFVWCVRDGLAISSVANAGVHRFLNQSFWPFSYAHMRRMADFQNRVLAKYASTRGLDFLDVASQYPTDPRLFLDAIHMTPPGVKLMAWVAFQSLIPVVERQLKSRALPQPAHTIGRSAEAFLEGSRLTRIADIRSRCRIPASQH
jgi:hypothetical protein